MKVTFDRTELDAAIRPALCAASTKNTITAIEGILFDISPEGKCVIVTYDLEKGIREEIDCKTDITEKSGFIINAQKLTRIIQMMPGNEVEFEIEERNIVKISSGNAKFELHCLPGSEFPSIPQLQGINRFKISQNKLKLMIQNIQFAIAVNDQRQALNGAFFEIKDGRIRIVSCDGNRLAIRESECEKEKIESDIDETSFEFIVPGKTINELLKLMKDSDDEISIAFTSKHIIFFLDNLIFFSRLIDAQYINYEKFIRKYSPITVKMSCNAFINTLMRTALVTEDRILGQAKSSVKCLFEGDRLKISASNISGSVYDEIPIEHEGENILIGFINKVILDALQACPKDSIKIKLESHMTSMIIESADEGGEDKFTYMVLPVKLQNGN